ncbi:MAG TPA: phosphate ABC transporter permease subunit PstC [Thermoleophilaceae bacterium]|nr:phosphate ABC transporter permease subunit PstC [Thermoleophilaceae bacterium]
MSARDSAVSRPGSLDTARRLETARPRYGELAIAGVLFACALVSVLTTTGIVIALAEPTIEFFQAVSFKEFLTTTDWAPTFTPASFGVIPIVVGTLSVTFWALLVAIPFGLGAAIFLSEYAGERSRRILKPALEVLEGIPTIAYGFFALTFVTPLLRDLWFLGEEPALFNVLSAGLVMGVMILPTVATISDDAMRAVPAGLREGAYALGGSRRVVATRVVVPAALSGIVASFVLGFSRAIGETVIVLLAAGAIPNLTLDPRESVQTMTAFIAATGSGDIATGTITYKTIFAVGSLLFVMTMIVNLISIRLVNRFREVYE